MVNKKIITPECKNIAAFEIPYSVRGRDYIAELLLAVECLKERLYDTTMLATTPGITPAINKLSSTYPLSKVSHDLMTWTFSMQIFLNFTSVATLD
jgi:hypothetical protein